MSKFLNVIFSYFVVIQSISYHDNFKASLAYLPRVRRQTSICLLIFMPLLTFSRHDSDLFFPAGLLPAKSLSDKKQANSSCKIVKLSTAVTNKKPVVEFGRTKLQNIADDLLDEMGWGVITFMYVGFDFQIVSFH